MVPWPWASFWSWYLRLFRNRVQCAFGSVKLTACHPEVDLFLWKGGVDLCHDGRNVLVELFGTARGPSPAQVVALQTLEAGYGAVLERAGMLVKKPDLERRPAIVRPLEWKPQLLLKMVHIYQKNLLELGYEVDGTSDPLFKVFTRRNLELAMYGWERVRANG